MTKLKQICVVFTCVLITPLVAMAGSKVTFTPTELSAMAVDQALDIILSKQGEEWLKSPVTVCVTSNNGRVGKGVHKVVDLSDINRVELNKGYRFDGGKITYPAGFKTLDILFNYAGMINNTCKVTLPDLPEQQAMKIAKAFLRVDQISKPALTQILEKWFAVDTQNTPSEAQFIEQKVGFDEGVAMLASYIKSIEVTDKGRRFGQTTLPVAIKYSMAIEQTERGKIKLHSTRSHQLVLQSDGFYKGTAHIDQTRRNPSGQGETNSQLLQYTKDKKPLAALTGKNAAYSEMQVDGMTFKTDAVITQQIGKADYFPLTIGEHFFSDQQITQKRTTLSSKFDYPPSESQSRNYEICMPQKVEAITIKEASFNTVVLKCGTIGAGGSSIIKTIATRWVSTDLGITLRSEYVMKLQMETLRPDKTFSTHQVTQISW